MVFLGRRFLSGFRTGCQFLDALQHGSRCVLYLMPSPVSLASTLLSDHEADELCVSISFYKLEYLNVLVAGCLLH